MKQWIVVSGKGGTGKTSVTAAFAVLARNRVLADCDVDAADLHLIAEPQTITTSNFFSGFTAEIDQDKCVQCGLCHELCRFNAISLNSAQRFEIESIACEGCLVCNHFCLSDAIKVAPNHCGVWHHSDTRFGNMIHAHLFPGSENSGKLVACVREHAQSVAASQDAELILIDGPPGVGCPVISSMSGTDLAILVTEPSPSGRHDLMRIIDLTQFMKIPTTVIINKWDLNPDYTRKMERELTAMAIQIAGRIRYDKKVYQALVQGKSILEYTDNGASRDIRSIWKEINSNFNRHGEIECK